MKKAIKVNISGLIFNLDEDAYRELDAYLEEISRRFSSSEEDKEIYDDIEARIAELLQDKMFGKKDAVSLKDVREVISVLGTPDDFGEPIDNEPQTDYQAEQESTKTSSSGRTGRRMYRDPDNRIIGGVCSGISNYFGIDPIILRLLFVIVTLFFGGGVLAYIILWVIIPEAKTTAQKLEMMGKPVTVNNIERIFKNEYENVKESFHKISGSGFMARFNDFLRNVFDGIGKVLRFILKIIAGLFGVIFILTGLAVILALIVSFIYSDSVISSMFWADMPFSVPEFFSLFAGTLEVIFFSIGLFLVLSIPLFMLVYIGFRIVFRFEANHKLLGFSALGLWILGIGLMFITGMNVSRDFRRNASQRQEYTLNVPAQTIYLELDNENQAGEFSKNFINIDNAEFITDGKEFIYGKPEVDIRQSETDKFEVIVYRHSKGRNKKEAENYAKKLRYEWQQIDSVLKLSKYYKIKTKDEFRFQEIELVLFVPKGKSVHFGKNIDEIVEYTRNNENYEIYEMTGKTWFMTPNGLSLSNTANRNEQILNQQPEIDTIATADTTKNELKEAEQELEKLK